MGMAAMGGGAVVQTSQGLQPCFKCRGNGWAHTSDMPHDKGENEKCFFCKDCDACGGSGAIAGGTTTVQQVGMPAIGGGMMGGSVAGWNPNAMCDGIRAEERCQWLQRERGMAGQQAQQQVMSEFPGAFGSGGMMGGMGMAPVAVQTSQALQPCFKCSGNGYCHNSSMPHDKGPNEKCFFCKSCDACAGSGAIQGGTTTVQQVGMPGMGYGMGGAMVAQNQGLQYLVTIGDSPCFKCDGKGFAHDSSMPHDKGPDEKCFFCKSCTGCGGSGAIQ